MAKIPDLPENERPRERFARQGAGAVSDAELLAIFLRTGVRGKSVVDIGRKLLKKHGSLNALGGLSVQELSMEYGLGPAKSAQLLAAFELGARCANEKMLQVPMSSPEVIYKAVAPRLAHERKEHVLVILLDAKLRATRTIELSVGNSTTALCSPRDVLHHVLINQATSFVLIHNHPSGDPAPSKQDIRLTRDIAEAASLMQLRLIDHLIIGRPSDSVEKPFYSFTDSGRLS